MLKLLVWLGAFALVLVSVAAVPLQLSPGFNASLGDALLFVVRDILVTLVVGAAFLYGLGALSMRLMNRSMFPAMLILVCMMASPGAFAQAATASTAVDLTSVANTIVNLVLAAIASVAGWLIKRAVVALEGIHVLQTSVVHGSAIDDAVTAAVSFARSKLDALIDPKLQMTMTNSILAEAAQLVVTTAPVAIAALNLTPASVQAKIQLALGDPLAVVDTSAPAATAPVAASPPVANAPLAA
jgi:hypothetical protein